MPSSDALQALHFYRLAVAIGCAATLAGCAFNPLRTPAEVAARQRLEAGIETPEEALRFRTPERERQQLEAARSDFQPPLAGPEEWALWDAIAHTDPAAIKAALARGARVNAADANGQTALLRAIASDDLETVQQLLRAHARVDGMDSQLTPLAAAAQRGNVALLQVLLRAGATVNLSGADGLTPLAHAAQGKHLAAVQVLIKAGAKVAGSGNSSASVNGVELFNNAVRQSPVALVEALLAGGADPNAPDADGLSPLYWAEFSQRLDVAQVLLRAGADPQRKQITLRTSRGLDPREY